MKIFNFSKIAKLFTLTLLLNGCATMPVPKEDRINNSKVSLIKIIDENTNSPLNGASCNAISSKNRHILSFNQPIVTISSNALRSNESNFIIKCNKAGYHSIERVIRPTASDNKEILKQSLVSGVVGGLLGGVIIGAPVGPVLPENIIVKMRKL
jgi:hypothetical protein